MPPVVNPNNNQINAAIATFWRVSKQIYGSEEMFRKSKKKGN